jgi:cellulose synthase/poly-beta-1,6-N-acetylglucosamine synthase-like glycosyltransferase
VYTILLPLYGEANLVADIIASVGALDWPRDRLDVKLLLEAHDRRPSVLFPARRSR